ncbi:MAG TPA: zf-HC2 domain-containing protein [Symbiobacteriaceae bacterium]|nr:zf-HC2 domain-containing protein [Symbiobacteriaceae bacterium]
MHCSQIEPLLIGYASGSLPAYKAAWVAQHLAGCEACQVLLAAERRKASLPGLPAAAPQACTQEAPAPALIRRGETSVAIQRPVPAWFRLMAVVVLAAAAAGCVWLWAAAARGRAPVRPAQPAWRSEAPYPVAHPWYEPEGTVETARYLPDATVGR